MNTVFVTADDGTLLMPTHAAKARRLLHSGKAVIAKHEPFTIRLTYGTSKNTQPVEIAVDTGYLHTGLSIKSQKHEYVSAQYDQLTDETERHNDCRKYRRARRNRLRYRRPKFNNRKKPDGWFAPSVRHKIEAHVRLVRSYYDVCPVTSVTVECGQFDTQVLKAIQEGKPIPHGVEYQRGGQYGYDTLREALFSRDYYTCQICGRTPWKDKVSLHRHHMGFWQHDHSNRMGNLLTVCNLCHTPKNHKPGGTLYGLKRRVANMAAASFMNSVKYEIYRNISEFCDSVHITYGATTKHVRRIRNIGKTHANDAFCIGSFHPKHRTATRYFEKRRRNSRILSKFYDAKYIDSRDGSVKSGAQLSKGRINRNHSRDSENLHRYRQYKKSKGRVSVRKQRYSIQPGDVIKYQGKEYMSNGCQHYGQYVTVKGLKSIPVKQITVIRHTGGWKPVTA